MKKLLLLVAALVTVTAAHATFYTTNSNWSVNKPGRAGCGEGAVVRG